MIEFLSGAVALGFVVAALFFPRFWRRTADRLFLAFAVAFALLALNQALAQWLGAADERVGYTYLLRGPRLRADPRRDLGQERFAQCRAPLSVP